MALSVHHLAVVVSDLDRGRAFYSGVLGMPVVTHLSDDAGRPRAVWLALGGSSQEAFLAIERAGVDGPARHDAAPGWHCVAFAISLSDRDEWRQRLAGAGYPV